VRVAHLATTQDVVIAMLRQPEGAMSTRNLNWQGNSSSRGQRGMTMNQHNAGAATLRSKLVVHRPAVAMAAHNPLAAKLATGAGFDAMWVSGFGLSASYAMPDAGLGQDEALRRGEACGSWRGWRADSQQTGDTGRNPGVLPSLARSRARWREAAYPAESHWSPSISSRLFFRSPSSSRKRFR
jgi:hypothetical protein